MAYFDMATALSAAGSSRKRAQDAQATAVVADASAARRDDDLEREYEGSLTDETSFAYGAMTMPSVVNRIIGNVSAGNMSKAEELYRGLDRFVSQHADSIARGSVIRPRSAFMTAMQHSSQMMMQRTFDAQKVVTPDGDETTLGELFGPDGLYRQRHTNELMRANVSKEAIAALEGGDAEVQATLRPFADAAAGSVPGAAARSPRSAAGAVQADPRQAALMVDHLARVAQKDAASVGWDALRTVTGYISSRYMNDGTATMMYDTVMRAVQARVASGLDDDPVQSASMVTRALDTAISRVSGVHSSEVNRFFAISLADAVAADPDLDFDSPGVQAGLARLADTVVTADRAGVPMLAEVLRAGGQFGKAAAGFIQSVSQGLEPPEDNLVSRLERGNARLSACLTGGWTPAAPAPADPAKSRGRAEGVLKATSGSPGLDAATVALYAKVRSDMNRRIARGEDDVAAFFGACTAPEDGGAGMGSAVSRSTLLSDDAARGIVDTWRGLVASGGGRPVSLEDAMARFALHATPEDDPAVSSARMATRRWLYGNRGTATARELERMMQKYVDPMLADDLFGLSGPNLQEKWNRHRQIILAKAISLMEGGVDDVESFIEGQGRVGWYYHVAGFYDTQEGKFVDKLPSGEIQRERYIPQIAKALGNLDDVELDHDRVVMPGFGPLPSVPRNAAFSNNDSMRHLFRKVQAVMKRQYEVQMKAAEAEYKRTAGAAGQGGL